MTLKQLLEQIISVNHQHLTLNQVKPYIEKLELRPNYPIILIGGTNGKGSTCAYLSKILRDAGFKVGAFTSPHVLEYNERICINGISISDIDLYNSLIHVMKICDNNLGLFKLFALVAHYWFIKQKVDIAIIEVGIGGRNDITNLFEPAVSAITSIDFDHCEILGNTLDKIGFEKAGIFRKNIPCFYGDLNPPQSVIDCANQLGANLQILGREFNYKKHEFSFDVVLANHTYYTLPFPSLRGNEQLKNVAMSLAILYSIKDNFPVPLSIIKNSLLNINLLGRFHVLPGLPQVIIDSAHNPQAITQMLQNMIKLPFVKRSYAVFGCAKDKDILAILKCCHDKFDKWFIAPFENQRMLHPDELTKLMEKSGYSLNNVVICEDIKKAYKLALDHANNDDRIAVFGSFLVIEQIYRLINS